MTTRPNHLESNITTYNNQFIERNIMATTKKTKWCEVLAEYDALIEKVWDMAFDGALSESEAVKADIIVKQYNDIKACQTA